jgi:hypothetical protein
VCSIKTRTGAEPKPCARCQNARLTRGKTSTTHIRPSSRNEKGGWCKPPSSELTPQNRNPSRGWVSATPGSQSCLLSRSSANRMPAMYRICKIHYFDETTGLRSNVTSRFTSRAQQSLQNPTEYRPLHPFFGRCALPRPGILQRTLTLTLLSWNRSSSQLLAEDHALMDCATALARIHRRRAIQAIGARKTTQIISDGPYSAPNRTMPTRFSMASR